MRCSVQCNQAFSPRVPASKYPFASSIFSVIKLFAFTGFIVAAPSLLRAQSNPPFKNPSLDSNCYFPQIDLPGEIDTIVGDSANAGIGAYIHNLGPQHGGLPGNLLIQGSGVFDQVATGPTFDLHDLKIKAKDVLNLDLQSIYFGHFHNSSAVDIFTNEGWIIYWADDNGNYDRTHSTHLKTNVLGNAINGKQGEFVAYIAHLTSDTIDDIVLGYGTSNTNVFEDSLYLVLYKGGDSLASMDTAYEDTSANFGLVNDDYYTVQGDFRGSGRDDLLIVNILFSQINQDNVYFYQNDPPFSLQHLAQVIGRDTLWTSKDNKVMKDSAYAWLFPPENAIVMHLLPKKTGDNSVDLAAWIPTTNDSNNSIFIFRGGPDFGSHRITIDSVAYVITPPKLGYEIWPSGFVDAGDMTGTGNHVLYTEGGSTGSGRYSDQNYYVTGQALDNKIDIFYKNSLTGNGDTLTANSDSLEDMLLGWPYYGDSTNGTIWLMYGSKEIPVHLNPQFADVKEIPLDNGAGITFAPNPITKSWSVATIIWPQAESAEYEVYNIMGSIVDKGTIRMSVGENEQTSAEQIRINFPSLPNGTYVFVVHGESHEATTKVTIMR
jgi:hypothetical protein